MVVDGGVPAGARELLVVVGLAAAGLMVAAAMTLGSYALARESNHPGPMVRVSASP